MSSVQRHNYVTFFMVVTDVIARFVFVAVSVEFVTVGKIVTLRFIYIKTASFWFKKRLFTYIHTYIHTYVRTHAHTHLYSVCACVCV